MIQFIHLFDERDEKKIRKNGIKVFRAMWRKESGVYVFPQTENFVVNRQWVRELRRRQGQNLLAARIRVPDEEQVLIGKHNEEHLSHPKQRAMALKNKPLRRPQSGCFER